VKGLMNAIGWMTILPVPKSMQKDFDLKKAMPWLPAIGLLVGFLLMVTAWLGALIDPWLGALFGVLTWFAVTGFIHADGLADLADALGAGHRDANRFLEVLKDPHIGSFGAVTLILLVTSKLVLLMLLVRNEAWLALLLIPVWSRLAAMWWMSLPSLSAGSASAMADSAPSPRYLLVIVLLLWLLSFFWVNGLWLAPLIVGGWHVFLRNHIGGMNGDCLGAGIELTETLMLMSCLLFI